MELATRLPQPLIPIIHLLEAQGAAVYLVGGCVRDHLLGKKPTDFDLEVYHMSLEKLHQTLRQFGKCDVVGKQFGIIKLFNLREVDFALPRIETKNGLGHRDFTVEVNPDLEIKEACRRRDFTMNAILYRVVTNEFIDPYGGIEDIKNKVIRIVDQNTFIEDPLRVYRLVQFVSRLDFQVETKTQLLCKEMIDKQMLVHLSVERIEAELKKMLLSQKPWLGMQLLEEFEILPIQSVEIEVLKKASQYKVYSLNPYGFMWSACLMNEKNSDYIKSILKLKRLSNYVEANKQFIDVLQTIDSKSSYFQLLALINGKTTINDLYYLRKCKPLSSFNEDLFKVNYIDRYGIQMQEPLITGDDLITVGFRAGKQMKNLLEEAYGLQLKGYSKEKILKILKRGNEDGTK